jgi:hypothetical protein
MLQVWQPGVDGMEDGEELQFDPTAYDCLHAFHLVGLALGLSISSSSYVTWSTLWSFVLDANVSG